MSKENEKNQSFILNALNTIKDGICIIDEKCTIIHFNDGLKKIIPEAKKGKKCFEILQKRESICPWCLGVEKAINTVIPFKNKEKTRWLDISVFPYKDEDGTMAGVIEYIRDVTEHEKSEELNRQLETKLHQIQLLEAIGTLSGGIAHDFNNILCSAQGFVELAQENKGQTELLSTSLDQIAVALQRANLLVKKILSFSKSTGLQRKTTKLQGLIHDTMELMRSSIPPNINVEVNIDTGCPPVFAESRQIQQVLINLCTNAYQAMEKNGGTLTINLEQMKYSEAKFLGSMMVVLTVKDTGHGMDNIVKDRIFEPFFTTREVGKGSGLGLSSTHGIIKQHGGKIEVKSSPGKGSSFSIYLPVFIFTGEHGDKEKDSYNGTLSGSETILLVDDEEAIVDFEGTMLKQYGYNVIAIKSSIEAWETFLTAPRKFDAIILNQSLTGMSGDNLAEKILKIRPDLPVIICTGYSDTVTEEKMKQIGLAKLLKKPVSGREMAIAIRRTLLK